MKYLKVYEEYDNIEIYLQKLSSDSKNKINDIEDILLEVNDLGYISGITHIRISNSTMIYVRRNIGMIVFNEVKDCLLRIKDYLGDNYDHCDIKSSVVNNIWGCKYYSVELDESLQIDDLLFEVQIITKKLI